MIEEWKPVIGYEEIYEVSNWGNVRSVDRQIKCKNSIRTYKGKQLSKCLDNKGYYRVLLSVAQKHKSALVHRLVAEAFIPNPEKLPEVNHKDENPANNSVDNLEWCTKIYNLEYGTGRARSNASQHRIPVIQYDLNGKLVKEYPSLAEASRDAVKKRDIKTIVNCCNGKFKQAYGYIWRYKE